MRVNLFWFLLGVLLLTSCADMGIVKRKHRPGFHVWFAGQGSPNNQVHSKSYRSTYSKTNSEPFVVSAHSSLTTDALLVDDQLSELTTNPKQTLEKRQSTVSAKSKMYFGNWKKMKIRRGPSQSNTESRQLAKPRESEKFGKWTILALVTLCAGITAIILVVMGLAFLVSWYSKEYQSNDDRPVLGLLTTGGILGLFGLIAGGLSKKRTKQTGEKGKGFALTGFITGIVSLALMILSFLVMAIGGPPRGR